ncbi:MAG TPA: dihydrolipoyl dehydrogenase [Nitrospiria bacterium]|jgi:mercury(II) reductase
MEQFDLVVIGAGSGGFAAARVATGLGKKVALIDKGPFGGLCILKGCMPSKTLLRSAELVHLGKTSIKLGVSFKKPQIDYPGIISRKNEIIKGFSDYRFQEVVSNPNITFIDGLAQFRSPREIQVGSRIIQGEKFVIGTGSDLAIPPIPGLKEFGFITSDDALELTKLPKSLAVLGAGAVGLELGQHFARMGVKVTILERSGHVLSKEDEDIGTALGQYLQEEGMEVCHHLTFERVSKKGTLKSFEITCQGTPRSVEVEEILLAAGRQPQLEGLNLEAAGVETNWNGIIVNDEMETKTTGIFAVGDVTGIYQLTHVAVYQGEVAGHNAFSEQKKKADYRIVPFVVFTDPTFAKVGLTEKEAQQKGINVQVASFPFNDLGKAICTGQTQGFAKMIADSKTGEILGVQVLGPEGGELIHEMIVAMTFRSTVQQFLQIPHYHPTLSEIFTYPAEEIAEKISSSKLLKT